MRPSSKYAALAFLMSTVGTAALQAADGMPHSGGQSSAGDSRLVFPKNTRVADRKARLIARRLQAIVQQHD